TEKNKKFFQHVVKEGGNKVLIFPFAQKNRDYDLQFELDSQKFIDNNPDLDIECAMASNDIGVLVEQIREYKSLYFCGGKGSQHIDILQQINNLEELLENKIISGNSAGSVIWAKYYYTEFITDVLEGLGYLDIKMMVHWLSQKYPGKFVLENLEKLKDYGEDLPVYTIREQEYEVFQV
ncbi:MAG TPA: Type 1 glutamine amidotransferase-like domain-containing protein, partial [Candidatus Absconditabacterales bacterium]|nr:Type 1 glutamine amidotransferase-like domain-containing protein [Candidatus Absconditabacterales bacterium]